MRVVHFGTFDVENFGDLLYPLIARRRLAGIGAELTFVSPVGGPAVWEDGVPTVSASALGDSEVDGVLVGGGNIVHAGPPGVDLYRGDGLNSLLAYTRLWLTPSEIARGRGIPLAWNAPGVPQAVTPRAAVVLSWAASTARYLSVRDPHSLRNLRHAGVEGPVAVVPDTALDVHALWSPEELAEAREALFGERDRSVPARTLAVHLNDRYIKDSPGSLAARLDRIAERAEATVVLLALGPCHGDDEVARAVGAAMASQPLVVDRPRGLRAIVATLAAAEAYLGSSLHGLVTAAAFGRPGLIVAREPSGGGKFSGFLGQFQLSHRLEGDWEAAEKRLGELLGAAGEFARVTTAAAPLLDDHWNRIAESLAEAPRRTGSARSKTAPSLYGIIEDGIEAMLAPDPLAGGDHARAAELEETRRRVADRDAILAKLSEALEQARYDREAIEERLERAEAAQAELEELRAALAGEAEGRREIASLHEESVERERLLRDRLVRERDDLEERLEATLAALNEARMPAPDSPDLEAAEAERDQLRAELLVERAAREGLEEHVKALRAEIERHAGAAHGVDAGPQPAYGESVPPTSPPAAADPGDPESVAAYEYAERYEALCHASGLGDLDDRDRALPWPAFPPVPEGRWQPHASIVVCVHNALDDVRRCLESVARHLTLDAEVVLVDDGSDAETARFLAAAADGARRVRLITNGTPPHGYTIAANLGLRAAVGEYLVLLNSDTIVTAGWLERIVACGEGDPRVGIVGPVSNAASHQSVPDVRHEGRWATNPLPAWLTVEGMAVAVAGVSRRERPRVPFVNGYCYVIKRQALDAVGYLDEELFAEGYCEENDFSMRARDAGFTGAVADDAFVYHAKSRSYTSAGRDAHAKRNYARFLEKHGADKVDPLVAQLERNPPVAELGRRVKRALADPAAVVLAAHERLGRSVEPIFVLPGIARGGSGGSHSIVQEASGLRALGVPARIAVGESGLDRAAATYPDHVDLFLPFAGEGELEEIAADANVLIATHSDSVGAVSRAAARHPQVLPAYYVQDYEPFFWPEGSDSSGNAADSYPAIAGACLFAKTHWLCNVVAAAHGVTVHKVEPSIDDLLYRPPGVARESSGPARIAAMVRPRTPRRRPRSTVRLLERLTAAFGDRVEVVTFGCERDELERITELPSLRDGHLGMLTRTQVADLLRGSDLFVDHSTYQAFGRTALEAMACGCVPLVPATGGAWEFAVPGENALVCDTRDEDAVYAAMAGLVEDADRRARLAEGALATASRYSIERAALSEFALFAGMLVASDPLNRTAQAGARAI